MECAEILWLLRLRSKALCLYAMSHLSTFLDLWLEAGRQRLQCPSSAHEASVCVWRRRDVGCSIDGSGNDAQPCETQRWHDRSAVSRGRLT